MKRFKTENNRQDQYTAIKLDRELLKLAKERARDRHQTYSEYVRQLIVRDVEKAETVV